MSKEQTYYKSLSEVANVLQIPYTQLYKWRHRAELNKGSRGYNIKKIAEFLEHQESIRLEEEKAKTLLGAEEELLEKQIKLETAKHKCRLLELQIAQKEGNLIDVNTVIETRTKEMSRLKKSLTEMVKRIPQECKFCPDYEIQEKLNIAINEILADLAEFITDNWSDNTSEEVEIITEDEE